MFEHRPVVARRRRSSELAPCPCRQWGITRGDHQEIVIAFGTAAQPPSPVPSTYQFPPGL